MRVDTRRRLPGKFVWFELVTPDVRAARAFYAQVFGWRAEPCANAGPAYEMLYAGDVMVGGLAAGPRPDWGGCVSVRDVDAAVRTAQARGGRVLEAPTDLPGVGRMARVADPQGSALTLLARTEDDPPDGDVPQGHFLWNELHTPAADAALAFWEAVVGYTHRSFDMGPAGAYHVLQGEGVGRGGVTDHLPPGAPPHWLAYVRVQDADATLARAQAAGGKVLWGPIDIPNAGRGGGFADPTGAQLAVLVPVPPPPQGDVR